MRIVNYTSRFRRDYKREKSGQHGKRLDAMLTAAVDLLAEDQPLPHRYFDHPLGGAWKQPPRLPHQAGPDPDIPQAGQCDP
jgi:mRNA interferase YafQ